MTRRILLGTTALLFPFSALAADSAVTNYRARFEQMTKVLH